MAKLDKILLSFRSVFHSNALRPWGWKSTCQSFAKLLLTLANLLGKVVLAPITRVQDSCFQEPSHYVVHKNI